MTILEAIQANPVFSNVPQRHIDSLLSGRAVDGSATYDQNTLRDVELISADLYYDMALLPEFREGQLSLKYDAEMIKRRAKTLYEKYDDPKALELGPRVIKVNITAVDDL